MSNSDYNFTHFLCIFVGHKCAKVKKNPKKESLATLSRPSGMRQHLFPIKQKHRLYSERRCADYKWMFYLLKAMKF